MSGVKQSSVARFKTKEAVIGIVGLGYVGLPLMLRYNAIGFRVLGIDIDSFKVDRLNQGMSYIEHIPGERIAGARSNGFEATTDFTRVSECDALILCVPTPLNKYREPDMSFVINTTDAIKPYLRKGQIVSLESTTYPGTTEEELLPRVQEGGLKVGEDIFLVYSPEREDPGNPNFETRTIPKIIGGDTQACLEVGIALYEQAIDRVVPVSSAKAAEMTKLLENIHRAVNIGLVNEMKIVADRMGIDIFEVVDAAATKPFGFTAYYPGPGLGGHCIPIDPFYLTWKAREYGLHTRFIELSGEVNQAMPEYVLNKLMDGLNNAGKALKGSKVLVLGIAYKKNVDDMRESPSVEIMELIEAKGGLVGYSDPHVPVFPKMREHHFELSSEPLTESNIASFDAVILATDHDKFDYSLIKQHARLIIDSRGKYREPAPHIIKA
ncbi:UDP-N-acetyl-D-glucosamine 6-dehydrogenase [Pseudomonas brassicacearum]|jgi:nucleotide sugar dehydrogenase|uniref:UDP-N-acetyl-D-glucosamine 6-dehydrogenase n=1 Tax=Pseudomonas brassicacearum TaxID=930166 RepID=UPI00025FE0BC|nr:UDP-N-acetyl-D-glucosamine 6-dehydrogenase [Pseudomonas brassicacearum]EIK65395.1 UDP-N-acetyl-d-glucosamine 6-dehydrogenase WbpA [Pseudomonas fluorescens Q8r1-96]KAB0523247.1 nucleotide sugar dehydrogenase [Pseudomonas brassicacearum subsp. brassicacearum]NJP62366.1 nucleotide sugar dehydrogenase [Pseudomonas brassicacearum]QEO77599.1 nucleotide sugar dehydrogenase [Pseudomonas brassicacearum]SDP00017.1 UDP-N-acetyl-D-glucosamine dehydrogenase [Pseudomonas brassicacearum]